MTLYNAFGMMALDQSVMAATPILKNILGALQATPYVYVVNPSSTTVAGTVNVGNFPATQNVKIVDAATPLFVDNALGQTLDVRTLVSTPVTVYQGAPFSVFVASTPIVYAQLINSSGAASSVTVTNFPATQNVNITQAATPLLVYQTNWVATPIVMIANPSGGTTGGAVTVTNWPATQNVTIQQVATPLAVTVVNRPATPIVQLANTHVSIENWPTLQNVKITDASTPIFVYQTNPISSVSVTNLPVTQNVTIQQVATPLSVSVINGVATPVIQLANTQVSVQNWPTTQNVKVVDASTPLLVYQTNYPATPIVYAQIVNEPLQTGVTFQPSQDSTGAMQPLQFQQVSSNTPLTNSNLVPAPAAGLSIRVVSYAVVSGAALNFTFNGMATPIQFQLAANGGVSFAGNLVGPAFQLTSNTALTYTTSAAGQVSGHICYVVV